MAINDRFGLWGYEASMVIDDFTLARVIHVLAVVGWIGGLWLVTFVVMPAISRNEPPAARLAAFHRIERGFAPQARIWVFLAGLSGFWMVWRADLWARFTDLQMWWMHAMLIVWVIFAAMLFVIEPLFLHRRMREAAEPNADFRLLGLMHKVLSIASMVTVIGAVAGSHGLI